MKLIRTLFVFFTLALVVGVVGIGIAASKGARIGALENIVHSMAPSERVFRDSKFGISFRYPKKWEQHYVSPDMILFSEDSGGAVMTLVLTKRKEAETLHRFREKNIQEIQESAASVDKKIDVEQVQSRALERLTAEQLFYHTRQNGVPIDGVHVWAVNDTKEYGMTFAARHDTFEAAVQVFDSVLKSVKIQ